MILGMSMATFVLVHVVISLIAIVAGLIACGVAAIADGDALRIFGRG